MKRKWRAISSVRIIRSELEKEVRDEDHGHAGDENSSGGSVHVRAGRDEGGSGFVNASVRTITNARRVGMRMQSQYTGTHRHARVNANNTIEKGEQTRTWVRQVASAMEEQLREDWQELKTREQKRKAEDAKRIRWIVHENNKNNRMSQVQDEMGKLTHHDGFWEGWHWDDNKGGWLDPELCAKARREEVEYIRRHKMCTSVPREVCQRETRRAPIKTGWAENDKGQPGKPNVRARWVAKEHKTHARPVDAAAGGAERSAAGGRHW